MLDSRLFAEQFPIVLLAAVVELMAQRAAIGLLAVTSPAIDVVPAALEMMRKEQILVMAAGLQGKFLLLADTSMGHALVLFRAGSARNCRKGAAVGTAHDKLQVALAHLCHGDSLLKMFYWTYGSSRFRREISFCLN